MGLKMRKSKVDQPMPECAVDACMWLLGGAWTPTLLWYLSGGPRRFGELRADIPGISAKVLSGRLKDMEDKGVVIRTLLPTSPPSAEYSLSPLGQELLPAINEIARIGHRLKLLNATESLDGAPPVMPSPAGIKPGNTAGDQPALLERNHPAGSR